jgi:hypothetical protein
MCCKLLNIRKGNDGGLADFPFDKPPDVTCKHCDPGRGCKIFGTPEFPNLCKSYFCLWKLTGKEQVLPEGCRPDKVHAIFQHLDALPELPGHRIMAVFMDPHREISGEFIRCLECGADLGLSFLVRFATHGGVLSDNPELAKALGARERAHGGVKGARRVYGGGGKSWKRKSLTLRAPRENGVTAKDQER